MKTKTTTGKSILISIIASIIVLTTAFTTITYGQKTAIKMVYNLPAGKTITYTTNTAVSQVMDIQGQTVNQLVNSNLAFKVKMVEKQGDNLKLEITIDSMGTKMETMQGSMDNKMKEVQGKQFSMILSPLGKTIDASDAAKIEFAVEGQGNSNLGTAFNNVFPILNEKEIKPGDTWEKNDTINTTSTVSKQTLIVKSSNKFEGIEKVNGIECAKIVSSVTGSMHSNVQNMGMDIVISGPTTGQITLWFAFKEGYFVKQEVIQKMNGTVDVSGPQSMSFPISMDTTSKTELK